MEPALRAWWSAQATGVHTGWNVFCGYNLAQAQAGYLPQATPHAIHTAQPPAPADLTVVKQDRAVVFTWTDAPGAFTTGLFLGASPGFTPALCDLVACVPAEPGARRQATVQVASGVWYAAACSGGEDGGVGTASAGTEAVEV
jgi:hypothetical protein